MLNVMGLDLSSKTGVAVVRQDKKLALAAEYEFEDAKGFERCNAIAEQVYLLTQQYQPALVCIEAPITSSKFNNYVQTEIAVTVRYYLWQNNIPYLNVSPSSLKKFITGVGNCNKNVVMMSVFKQWGIESPTDNIADAVGLAMWGLCAAKVPFTGLQLKSVREATKKFSSEDLQLIAQASLTN